MKHQVTEAQPSGNTVPDMTPDWVLAEKYRELTGVTPMAIHNRRRSGTWLDGKHCGVVDRRLYVNLKEADNWIKSQLLQPQRA